jgi:hypothetical protein
MLLNISQLHRLVTKEDGVYFHVHKILGLLVLSHFLFRGYNWITEGNMKFDTSMDTVGWIAVHMLLHVSSFQFALPQRRIKTYNIIWPEFRLHSMIFAYRSLITMAIMWLSMVGRISTMTQVVLRGALVLLIMVLADMVTKHFKSKGLVESAETTMRTNPYPEWFPKEWVKYHNLFYSASQVLATMECLTSKDIACPFVLLVAIQTAPFCMTLVKKGVIDQTGWHVYYTVALGFSYLYGNFGARLGTFIPRWLYWALAIAIMFGRFRLDLNKYFIWTLTVLFHTLWVVIMNVNV